MVQPGDGIDLLLKMIKRAKKSIEVVIFRLDLPQIEHALVEAAEGGVFVHALVAFTNRGGEKRLRDLEANFLSKGITVARTAGDLVRYHGKMMIVDRQELALLAFNFTTLDIEHSRSFGIVTRNPKLVQEAAKLFEADTKRQDYGPGYSKLVVSPVNARKQLAAFLRGAKKELLIYDPKISDKKMIRLLEERMAAGVKVRLIGEVAGKRIEARKLDRLRLHTRTIIRDQRHAFVGSQSLRRLELDTRREIGAIFRDAGVVAAMSKIFEADWQESKKNAIKPPKMKVQRAAKKLAKIVHKELPLRPVVKEVVKAIKKESATKLRARQTEKVVREAIEASVRNAVKDAAAEVVKEVVEEPAS